MNFRALFPRFPMSFIAKTLLFAGMAISIALSAASYTGFLPLGIPSFLVPLLVFSISAAYRPGWIFLLLVSVLPLEIVNLAPPSVGTGIRPYQFLMISVFVGLGIRFLMRRSLPTLPKPNLGDLFLLLVPIGSLFAVVNAPNPDISLRLSVILFTYYALYALFRTYVRSSEDIGRVLPFITAASLLSILTAIMQNAYFIYGNGMLEVMPGRPNALFAEPDWLGMFLIAFIAILVSSLYMLASRTGSFRELARMKRSWYLFAASSLCFVALILSVSRSAWFGAVVSIAVSVLLTLSVRRIRIANAIVGILSASVILSLAAVLFVPLTNFDLFGRAGSIRSGLQTITVSCSEEKTLPAYVATVEELAAIGCRHINLEEIDTEKAAGRFVAEINRNDPNISIRKQIYERSVSLGLEHPALGIGWGSVTKALGTDNRGAGLNASDVLLEVWLGSGLLGIVGFLGFLLILAIRAFRDFFRNRGAFPFFLISAFAGLVAFDLFNSGILLGFFWALLGIAGSYVYHESDFSETL